MSNLTGNQTMTTLAKKVGGPRNLFILTFVGGGITFKIVEKGAKGVKVKIKDAFIKGNPPEEQIDTIYVVSMNYSEENGINLFVGDEFRILASDEDAILIEVLGDDNNPYFVSEEVLSKISNYCINN